MRNAIKFLALILVILLLPILMGARGGCTDKPDSDDIQSEQQERILAEGTSQVGMPGIRNFRERKLAKQILELRDQEGLVTYAYLWNDTRGCVTFFCDSIGYGLPYATQFSNPQKIAYKGGNVGVATLPQADPNGLFSPASAEGTWVICKNPTGTETQPIYVEPRTIVSPFKMDHLLCAKPPAEKLP